MLLLGTTDGVFRWDETGVADTSDGPERVTERTLSGGGLTVRRVRSLHGRVYAGTDRGRVLVREADGWVEVARVPACIRSLAFLDG